MSGDYPPEWLKLRPGEQRMLYDARAKTASKPLFWLSDKSIRPARTLVGRGFALADFSRKALWATSEGVELVQRAVAAGYRREPKRPVVEYRSKRYKARRESSDTEGTER